MGAERPKLSQVRNRSHEKREPPDESDPIRISTVMSVMNIVYSIVYRLSVFCLSKGREAYNRKSRGSVTSAARKERENNSNLIR